MSIADEPGQIRPEFAEVIDPLLTEIQLDPDALRLVNFYLRRGSVAVDPRRRTVADEPVETVAQRLSDVSRLVATDLRNVGQPISRDALVSVLQSHCGVPPFCYGEAGGEEFRGDDAGSDTTARELAGIKA